MFFPRFHMSRVPLSCVLWQLHRKSFVFPGIVAISSQHLDLTRARCNQCCLLWPCGLYYHATSGRDRKRTPSCSARITYWEPREFHQMPQEERAHMEPKVRPATGSCQWGKGGPAARPHERFTPTGSQNHGVERPRPRPSTGDKPRQVHSVVKARVPDKRGPGMTLSRSGNLIRSGSRP